MDFSENQPQVLFESFWAWFNDNQEEGIDGEHKQQAYIPCDVLETYGDHDRIKSFLDPEIRRNIPIELIRNQYLKVFFILVSISTSSDRHTGLIELFIHHRFDDSRLPITSRQEPGLDDSPFPPHSGGQHAWEAFIDQQWRLMPLQIIDTAGYGINATHECRQLDVRHILPFKVEGTLTRPSGSVAKIFQVSPHRTSNIKEKTVIMKQYQRDEREYDFDRERRTYTTLINMDNDRSYMEKRFLRYYGSFLQGDKCVLLVEYASEGTLLDVFRKCWSLPCSGSEAYSLWIGLGNLIAGLDILHGTKGMPNIHRDIKPSNIFISLDDNDPKRLVFRLGDFGVSSSAYVSKHGEAVGQDNWGSVMYSPPETVRLEGTERLRHSVTSAADIWSLGCVFFEAAIWMCMFNRGRVQAYDARIEALRGICPILIQAGHGGCFHDGREPLAMLRDVVEEIKNLGTPVSYFSHQVMEFVLEFMLVGDPRRRLGANYLHGHFRTKLDHFQMQQQPSLCATQPVSPVFSQGNVFPSPQMMGSNPPTALEPLVLGGGMAHEARVPGITQLSSGASIAPVLETEKLNGVSMASGYRDDGRHKNDPRHSFSHSGTMLLNRLKSDGALRFSTEKARPSAKHLHSQYQKLTIPEVLGWTREPKKHRGELPGKKQALEAVANRDHVFIIDNSASMMAHWDEVIDTVNALVHLLKDLNPDRFEIHLTNGSNMTPIKLGKNIFKRDGFLDKNRPRNSNGPCPMEKVLSEIVLGTLENTMKKVRRHRSILLQRRITGVSIYVLTNGVWEASVPSNGANEASGVENAIRSIVKFA
ncbi:kinase-like domain-containing protein [Astrocystis sublimbata]|nr:kinase-like domain-containing protein [Astrocystis sublimbata]